MRDERCSSVPVSRTLTTGDEMTSPPVSYFHINSPEVASRAYRLWSSLPMYTTLSSGDRAGYDNNNNMGE